MAAPTSPAIFVAQNTQDARRRVSAQARLYSEAKRLWVLRVAAVCVLAVATGAAALAAPSAARTAIGVGGGFVLLVLSFVGGGVEKRKRHLAAAVQEEFDTGVFRLPWNDMESRPPPTAIAQAAARYDGGRDKDWYPDTKSTHRPFDVLICQSSNLGWGATTHRTWAWLLTGAAAALVAAVAAAAVVFDLKALDFFAALVAPAFRARQGARRANHVPLRDLPRQGRPGDPPQHGLGRRHGRRHLVRGPPAAGAGPDSRVPAAQPLRAGLARPSAPREERDRHGDHRGRSGRRGSPRGPRMSSRPTAPARPPRTRRTHA